MPRSATPKKATSTNRLVTVANALVAVVFIFLPFHAVFTTWLGANFGHLGLFRIWKELLLIPIGLISFWFLLTTPAIKQKVARSWLFWLVIAYIVLTIVMGLWAHSRHLVSNPALINALLINLRFVSLLVFCWIIGLKSSWLYDHWRELLTGAALLVVAFGIAQWLILPAGFLTHFGYGPHTIPAIQTVDQQAGYQRFQSTLRGANPLGAYLILIFTAFLGMVLSQKQRQGAGAFLTFITAVLLLVTYSRSAYIGAFLSALVLLWYLLPQTRPQYPWRKWMAVLATLAVLIVSLATIALRNTDQVQNVAFHSSNHSQSAASSNAVRTNDLKQGIEDVKAQPLGGGPGTAGPASARNAVRTRIAENYYIQLAQEIGVIGLAIFTAINCIVAFRLWERRRDLLALVLLASFVGISFVNLVSHAWTDDTLSLIWWGFAGLALAEPAILIARNKKQTDGQKTS